MNTMKSESVFVGRDRELAQLRAFLDRSQPSIAVVYGRRRVGKSALIRKALDGRPALYFEGLENQPTSVQLSSFRLQLATQTGPGGEKEAPKTWREAFLLLEPVLKQTPACVVLDEFQWMANYWSAAVSDLKMVWEQYLSRIPGVSLIMCGSIASFMLKKVVKGSALYGRTDRVIHLREFCLAETREMLPDYGTDELLDAYMMLGGIPNIRNCCGITPLCIWPWRIWLSGRMGFLLMRVTEFSSATSAETRTMPGLSAHWPNGHTACSVRNWPSLRGLTWVVG